MPPDWSLNVDAGEANQSVLSAVAGHGAGALSSTDELRNFETVCELQRQGDEPELSVEGTLSTTTDFQSVQNRKFAYDVMVLHGSN